MMEEKLVMICEPDLEGIFTAVYDGWLMKVKGTFVEIRTEMPENLEFFCRYEEVVSDPEKAEKVLRTIRRKLGNQVYEDLCYAAVSGHQDRGTAIFMVIWQAMSKGRCNGHIMEALADPYVNLVSKLRMKVWYEYHRFLGFVRFREMGGGVLFSQIAPENDILVMLGPHFANRFPKENWMIYDERRGKVLMHRQGEACTLQTGVSLSERYKEQLCEKEEYELLWREFCKSITIEERKNPGLQQQMLPKKFRHSMTEFF